MDLEQRRRNDQIIGGLLALIPDALIGFAVMKLHDDQWSTFWWTIVALQGVYFFFWLKKKVWESVV